MTEQTIQSKIKKYLMEQGAYVVKVIHGTTAGIPDLLVCYKGIFVAFEVKQPGKKATELQKAIGNKIKKAGGIFEVVTSLNHVQQIIEGINEQLCSKSEGEHQG